MSDKKLFLLDGHALVYRAHFAFITRPLINSKGVNTSAINGFVNQLWDLMRNEKPTHIAVAFDPHGPTFRHDMYEPYKANREEQPQDIGIAIPWIEKIVRGMNIPIVMVQGYEADDVIGTLAKQAEAEGFTVYMVTPDKDYGQLVSENIFMYKPSRQGNGIEIMGVKEVCENWGIKRVEQVIDILGLMGDSVDNIPGIPGFGEKTAAKLLDRFDSVEGVIANVNELKGKEKERVEQYAEQALLSKKLAVIETQVPIQFDANQYIIDPPNREVLSEIFKELEFRSIAKRILGEEDGGTTPSQAGPGQQGSLFGDIEPGPAPLKGSSLSSHSVAEKNIDNTPHQYHLVNTPEATQKLAAELSKQKEFCFDTETTHVEPTQAELVGMSFSYQSGEAFYVPVPAGKDKAQALVEVFRPVLEDEKITKIAQNLKYDAIVFKWYGVEIKGAYFDTMVAHYLLEPEMRHGMDYLAETYLSYSPVSIETLIGKGKGQLNMRDVPVEKVCDYAAEDADITLQLKLLFAPKLAEGGVQELFDTIECPLIKVLADLEYEGVRIDSNYLAEYSRELESQILSLEQSIYEQAGVKFNIGSPKQVGDLLFERLKIPYKGAKTKTGQYSTDEDKLQELAPEFPIIQTILNYRGLTKLKSTYVDALPKMVNPRTGRIHSSFNQALAATGRLSSNNPNLQNIPVRTPEGAKVRRAFIPRDENHTLLSADYSQIELRLIAEISEDAAMLEAFQNGQDIHTATAAKVFNVPFDQVTREQRYQAKTVNFSIVYGAGATNLSRQLSIKRTEAKELIDAYFAQYKGLKVYMDGVVEEARKSGYVTTLMGRRRYLRDINSKSSLERSNAERIAVNTPVQGSAADMIKVAMVNIHRELLARGLRTKMILQVHDELVFDVPTEELEIVKPIIVEKMRTALPKLKVPIEVGLGTGLNWLEAH
ncbi:MAG: DNA polymerase I [Haliscomenobacter sp.]|uniref:DNA polymerase I n=1 Tax=Haliscomenobacter sp. TaxID=2717303 RepID=UPI0029BE9775|nr:DNA polymerase I [Haliscomenobacter sp.]MDX2067004.1 DNA polymerase I [Haliscomenobacter sp.]